MSRRKQNGQPRPTNGQVPDIEHEELMSPDEAYETASTLYRQAKEQGLLSTEAAHRLGRELARQRAPQFRSMAVFPAWVHRWQLQQAHASFEESRETFDFRPRGLGLLEFRLRLVREEGDEEGFLRLSWESEAYHEEGWWVAFYLDEQNQEAFLTRLPGKQRGFDIILTQDDLGFDPTFEAFEYIVYPG